MLHVIGNVQPDLLLRAQRGDRQAQRELVVLALLISGTVSVAQPIEKPPVDAGSEQPLYVGATKHFQQKGVTRWVAEPEGTIEISHARHGVLLRGLKEGVVKLQLWTAAPSPVEVTVRVMKSPFTRELGKLSRTLTVGGKKPRQPPVATRTITLEIGSENQLTMTNGEAVAFPRRA